MSAIVHAKPYKLRAGVLALAVHFAFFSLLYFGASWRVQPPQGMVVDIWDSLPGMETAPVKVEVPKAIEQPELVKPVAPPRADIELSEKKRPQEKSKPIKIEPKLQTKKVDVQVEKKKNAEQKVRTERERVRRIELANAVAKTLRNVKAQSEKAEPSKVVEPVQSELKAEVEKAEAEKAKADKAKADKAKADKAKADKAKADKAEADKAEADKAEADKAEADKAEADKAKAEKAEADKAKADKAKAEKAAAEKAAAEQAAAIGREVAEYKAKIIAKIRRNIVMLPDIPYNVTAEFYVTLLPGGMVLKAELTKPSGSAAYDSAVERAIKKAQPLPLPPDVTLFDKFRELRLTVRPI